MLEQASSSYKGTKAVAMIGLLLVSVALVGQGFVNFQQASAAPRWYPTVSITGPTDGATVISQTGTIKIQGTASDNTGGSGIKVVEVQIDYGTYAIATPKAQGDWSSWSISLQTSAGTHGLLARATDNAGNQASTSINIRLIIDTALPSVSITTPANGVTVPLTTTLIAQGSATDNTGGSGIQTVQARINGGSYITAIPKSSGDWSSWTASFASLISGTNTLYAKAIDKAGNYRVTSITLTASDSIGTADTTPPTIKIVQPASDSVISLTTGGNILIKGIASDSGSGVKIVEVRVDAGSYLTATPKSPGDWSSWSTSLPITAGQHRLVPRATDNAGNQGWNSIYVTITDQSSDNSGTTTLDKFGIKKLYQTVSGGNEWYVNMNDPKSDPMFRNLPSMTKQADGSWQVSATQVRMEAWSPAEKKWLNVEITGYAKIIGGSSELIQWYSRGGHHTSSNPCLGSAYKARLYGDGEARWVKEVTHPAYAGNRGSVMATSTPLEDRWVGFKAVISNFMENGKTYVRMQSYIDDDVTDSSGNLLIRNNWKPASMVEDRGGWSTSNTDFDASCFPVNKDSTQQYRQRDEILNMSGGTSTQNIAAWRSDDLTWNWKYLSVREISVP